MRLKSLVPFFFLSVSLLAVLPLLIGAPRADAKPKPKPLLYFKLANGKASIWLKTQIRHRLEYDERRDFADLDDFQIVTQRARLTLGAKAYDRVSVLFQVQDVRTWGEEVHPGPTNNPILSNLTDFSADGFDGHQAFAQVRLWRNLAVRGGRMEIIHDNHRLVGSVNWTQQARSFDGLMVKWKGPWIKAHLFWAKLAESHSTPHPNVDGDADVAGLWVRLHRFKFFRPSLNYIVDIDQRAAVDRQRHTVGLYIDGLPFKGLKYTGEFFYQVGKQGAADIAAFLAAVRVDYKLPVRTKPSVSVWADIVSGDGNPSAGAIRSFNTLFATNHKFYGYMDFFLNTQAHTGNRGLLDVGARFKMKPLKKLVFWIDYHAFRLMRPDANDDQALGHEVDVTVKFVPWRFLALQLGYSLFVPQSAIKTLRSGGNRVENWFYLQSNIAF